MRRRQPPLPTPPLERRSSSCFPGASHKCNARSRRAVAVRRINVTLGAVAPSRYVGAGGTDGEPRARVRVGLAGGDGTVHHALVGWLYVLNHRQVWRSHCDQN
eukprot:1176963-Prorocentrum_minimum.AAC.1